MFQSARLKLTAWYLVIIMFVSLMFSLVIYTGVNQELTHIEELQQRRRERDVRILEQMRREREDMGFPVPSEIPEEVPVSDLVSQARWRIITILGAINLGIFSISALAGYFLAGRTLKPIKQMVDEQKRFIADASHELRTPLTSLKSEIEVGLRDKKITLKEAKLVLESNLEEVNNLQLLSDNLIRLTKYQGNNHETFEKISLKVVLEEAIKKVEKLAKLKEIKFEKNIIDYKIEGETISLTELFVILLDNAIKYSPENTKVILSSKKTNGHILIQIKDQGYGIPKEDLPYIFDRFYRAEKSRTKTRAQGYGLGLSIANQIIEKHSGTISVKSETYKGTNFSINLPIKQK